MSLQERTLVVRGFDHTKLTHKLLKELCIQGGPVKKVVIREDHAFVEYEDIESVAYSKALLDGVTLFGEKLQIDPRVRSQQHFKYHQLLIDYVNYDKQCKMVQQPQPFASESQPQQPQPVIWEAYQQQQQQQQQQQFMMNQQLLLNQQQQQPQPPPQQAQPVGPFDAFGIFLQQSQQLQNNLRNAPHEYQPPPTFHQPQDPNYFVPNQMPHNGQNYQQQRRHGDHSSNHNIGRSRSFNDHHRNKNHNSQSDHRRQSAQFPDFKNRRR